MAKRNGNLKLIKVHTPSGSDVVGISVGGTFERETADLLKLLESVYRKGRKDGALALSQDVLKYISEREGLEIEIRGNGNSGVKASRRVTPSANFGSSFLLDRDVRRQQVTPIPTVVRRDANDVSPDILKCPAERVIFSGISVDFSQMEVTRNGEPVYLTAKEFRTLKFMVQNAERVITRDEFLNKVWGYQNYPSTRTVDNHILSLRHKLERDPTNPMHFRTVHGVGYKFVR
jgi:hypothetical protein